MEDGRWKMEDGNWTVMNDENNPISMGFGFLKPQSPQRKDTQRAQCFFDMARVSAKLTRALN